jgi:hypothetical protein
VRVAGSIDGRVALPGVREHNGTGLDVGLDEAVQRPSADIGNASQPDPAGPAASTLNGDRYQHFLALGPPAAKPWLLAADVGLVNFDVARQ